jgi:hypothetical protein
LAIFEKGSFLATMTFLKDCAKNEQKVKKWGFWKVPKTSIFAHFDFFVQNSFFHFGGHPQPPKRGPSLGKVPHFGVWDPLTSEQKLKVLFKMNILCQYWTHKPIDQTPSKPSGPKVSKIVVLHKPKTPLKTPCKMAFLGYDKRV